MEDKVGLVWNSFVGAILLLVSVLVYNYYNRTNKTKSEMKEEEKQLSNLIVLILTIIGLFMIFGSFFKYYTVSKASATLVSNPGLKNLTGISIPSKHMSGGHFYTDTEL